MIGRLRVAGRRHGLLLWATALIFAVGPALSMGTATPVGTFAGIVVHADDHGQAPHSHHDPHHAHDGTETVLSLGTVDDAQPNHHGQGRLHAHYDACCPSILVPVPTEVDVQHRVGQAINAPTAQPLYGASLDRLLRPPILQPSL